MEKREKMINNIIIKTAHKVSRVKNRYQDSNQILSNRESQSKIDQGISGEIQTLHSLNSIIMEEPMKLDHQWMTHSK